MANVSLSINPEDVNRILADAILESTIGKQVQETVTEMAEKLRTDYKIKNQLEAAVRLEIGTIVQKIVAEKSDVIREFVASQLTDDMLKTTLGKLWEAALRERF